VAKGALGEAMSIQDFGLIFGAGTTVYGLALLVNGPLVDKFGGKKGILLAALGAAMANGAMGLVLYLQLNGRLMLDLTLALAVLYSINMYFQSFGAVSIIKVKAYWFHVRERGIFGAIFGTLISVGVYFAFDWGSAIVKASKVHPTGEPTSLQKIFQLLFAVDSNAVDSYWLVFFIPSAILIFWAMVDLWLIKDTPAHANFEDFDTHDASSGEMHLEFTMMDLLKRVLASPLMLTFACIEFTTGVVRNGVMQWYKPFVEGWYKSANLPIPEAAHFFTERWGFLLCIVGIFGGFFGGYVSDHVFHSRRAPPAALAQTAIFIASLVMIFTIFSGPVAFGVACLVIASMVITTHSLMSGTAAADFGGRKATATASGAMDALVYLGSGLQSFAIGFLAPINWQYWPMFLAPFALIGLFLAIRTWRELPEATKKYLLHVEKVNITHVGGKTVITKTSEDIEVPS
jgi:OPA family glycerol-3-phosphate transporter-like MFS transporter